MSIYDLLLGNKGPSAFDYFVKGQQAKHDFQNQQQVMQQRQQQMMQDAQMHPLKQMSEQMLAYQRQQAGVASNSQAGLYDEQADTENLLQQPRIASEQALAAERNAHASTWKSQGSVFDQQAKTEIEMRPGRVEEQRQKGEAQGALARVRNAEASSFDANASQTRQLTPGLVLKGHFEAFGARADVLETAAQTKKIEEETREIKNTAPYEQYKLAMEAWAAKNKGDASNAERMTTDALRDPKILKTLQEAWSYEQAGDLSKSKILTEDAIRMAKVNAKKSEAYKNTGQGDLALTKAQTDLLLRDPKIKKLIQETLESKGKTELTATQKEIEEAMLQPNIQKALAVTGKNIAQRNLAEEQQDDLVETRQFRKMVYGADVRQKMSAALENESKTDARSKSSPLTRDEIKSKIALNRAKTEREKRVKEAEDGLEKGDPVKAISTLADMTGSLQGFGPQGSAKRRQYLEHIFPDMKRIADKMGVGDKLDKMMADGDIDDEEISAIKTLSESVAGSSGAQRTHAAELTEVEIDGETFMVQPRTGGGVDIVKGPDGTPIKPKGTSAAKAQVEAATQARRFEMRQNIEDINQALEEVNFFNTGIMNQILGNVGGSPSMELNSLVKTVQSNLTIDKISEMKAMSPNGSTGLGQITEKELDMLASAVAALNTARGPDELRGALKKVRDHYSKAIFLSTNKVEEPKTPEDLAALPIGSHFYDAATKTFATKTGEKSFKKSF